MIRETARRAAALCVVAAAFAPGAAQAAAPVAGDLDPAFGGHGYAIAQAGVHDGFEARAVVRQPDGKVVVAGGALGAGNERQFGFARFNPDGSLDPSFGGDGIVTVRALAQNGPATVHDLALDAEGRILAVGDMYHVGSVLTVIRLEPDGDRDMTFNGGSPFDPGWYYLHDQNGGNVTGRGIAVQPDGRIVVVGGGPGAGGGGAVIVRLLAGGAPDTSLDGDGLSGPHAVNGRYTRAVDVEVDAGGRIVASAAAYDADASWTPTAGVLRLTPAGALDTSFSDDGVATVRPAGAAFAPDGVALEGSGVLVSGTATTSAPATSRMAVARLGEDGAVDGGFGSAGIATVPVDATQGHAVLVHGGKVYVGGQSTVSDGGTDRKGMTLARLTTAGAVDGSFGQDGVSTWLVGTGDSAIQDLAPAGAGHVVAAGLGRTATAGSYAAALFATPAPAPVDEPEPEPEPETKTDTGSGSGTGTVTQQPPAAGPGPAPVTPPATRPTGPPAQITPAQRQAAATQTAADQVQAVFLALRAKLLTELAKKRAALVETSAVVPGRQELRFLATGARASAAAKKKTKKGKKRRAKVLASGAHTFTEPGTAKVRVRLTAAGRKAVRRGKRVRMVVQSTFTPVGGEPQVKRRTVALKVPKR